VSSPGPAPNPGASTSPKPAAAPPKAPEVSADGIREAQKLTSLSWKVDLAETGRMRIESAPLDHA
jgi:hypothetical protein